MENENQNEKLRRGRILIIAGSDSSGGAYVYVQKGLRISVRVNTSGHSGADSSTRGLEADQKVAAAHGCYAMTATTALTIQNTLGVYDVHHIPSNVVKGQIKACLDDIGTDVVKIGMLASADTARNVAETLSRYAIPKLVVDPVMVSTSGSQLLAPDAVETIRHHLIPITTILTPNLPEAMLLLRDAGVSYEDPPKSLDALIDIAKKVQGLGSKYVLLKGGHQPFTRDGRISAEEADRHRVIDILQSETATDTIETDYLQSKNTHGTGCSLASAIASNLALGIDILPAVRKACRYVEAGIKTSVTLGKGNGPINHFHSLYSLPFAPGRFLEYLLDRVDVRDVWREHTEHEFVRRLGDGTLPIASFRHYLIQDYLYLVQFARANALAAYKAKNMEDITASASIVLHINREMSLHLDYCRDMGLERHEVESQEEDQACTAYTRYVIDVGHTEDWLALQIAFAPCLLGYGMIARRLHDDPNTLREGNKYYKWIENYVAEDFAQAVRIGSDLLERHAVKQSPSRIEELVKIFIQATRMETGFWDMGQAHG